jgi:outer membrane protein OmpA-like peptidoglycan-associated protein
MRGTRHHHLDESIPWIGYADFLLTIAVLFFLIAWTASRARPGRATLDIQVVDSASGSPVARCMVELAARASGMTDARGAITLAIDSVLGTVRVGLETRCDGYPVDVRLVDLTASGRTDVTVGVLPGVVEVVSILPGDVLFEREKYQLREGAVERIKDLVGGLNLGRQDLLVIEGHTDDVRFNAESERDNWMLSGERAAAAARVFTDSAYGVNLCPAQVAIAGYGPSRPREPIDLVRDSRAVREQKRAANRRIEFRVRRGALPLSNECQP